EILGHARQFDSREALALLIAGEIISRGYGSPYEVLPLASRIARGSIERTIWIHRGRDGELAFADQQPNDVAVALPLPTLAARLHRRTSGQRIARVTR